MKQLFAAAALATAFAQPAFAGAFDVDFEKNWDYLDGDVNGYYAGGIAADGTTGPNLGVSFVNVSGLSNDPSFPAYSNAPSPLGVGYAHTFAAGETAFMNVAAGVYRTLSFYYSSPSAIVGAIRAFSGMNGTGTLLGTFDLAANSADFSAWTRATFAFGGVARSFDFTNAANVAAFDEISGTVPEPESIELMMVGGAAALCLKGRRRA